MTTLDAKGVVLEIWANPWANSVVRLLFEYQDVIKPKERRDIVRTVMRLREAKPNRIARHVFRYIMGIWCSYYIHVKFRKVFRFLATIENLLRCQKEFVNGQPFTVFSHGPLTIF